MGIFDVLRRRGLRSPHGIRCNGKRLSDILAAHEQFARGKEAGSRADLAGADLSRADLRGTDMRRAGFYEANLSRVKRDTDTRANDIFAKRMRFHPRLPAERAS